MSSEPHKVLKPGPPATSATLNMMKLQAAHRGAGGRFFDKDSTEFFDSKIEPAVYGVGPDYFFVTSEQFEGSDGVKHDRRWTVRTWNSDDPGRVRTVEKFQTFTSSYRAHQSAQGIAHKAALGE